MVIHYIRADCEREKTILEKLERSLIDYKLHLAFARLNGGFMTEE